MRTAYALALVAVVCALTGAGPAAADVTLGDGSYDIAFSATEAGADFAGTKSSSGVLDVESWDSLQDGSRTIEFAAKVNSDLALDLTIAPLGASSFGYPLVGTFELTGLDLLVDGNPADIIDVTFDAATTNIGQYADAGEFIAPTISFSATSATISFGFDGSGLAGDQPVVSFDLVVIPEPGAMTMLLVGGTLLARRVRRRQSHTVENAISP